MESAPGGVVVEGEVAVGTVVAWEPPRRLALEWKPATWKPEATAKVELRFDPILDGTRVTCELAGWGEMFGEDSRDLAGWFGSAALAPLFLSISPAALGDWLTDRRVRRPSGPMARSMYADPMFHWPNFFLILDRLAIRPDDILLEVGCGGGAFLQKALESGCRATAVDHSPEMVRLALELNAKSVDSGALRILRAEADRLPVPNDAFTCAVMTGVIGFLPDPVAALKEIHRSLRPGGRIAIFAGTAALRGTPAAPEPFASRIRFFERAELEGIGREAGFADAAVEEPDLEGFARKAGIPEDAIPMFRKDGGALLLTGRKAGRPA
jgi:SAM-dependent methyltransferase